jgi:hypothetical protein
VQQLNQRIQRQPERQRELVHQLVAFRAVDSRNVSGVSARIPAASSGGRFAASP